jgi:hypothetical protein
VHRERRDHRLDAAGRAEQVAVHRLVEFTATL